MLRSSSDALILHFVRLAHTAKPVNSDSDHCRSNAERFPPVGSGILRKTFDELVVADPHNDSGADYGGE